MAKFLLWCITFSLMFQLFALRDYTEKFQIAFLICLCVLTISEAIEKIGNRPLKQKEKQSL